MGKGKCKDCSKCTKSFIGKMISAPSSIVGNTVGKVTIGLFKKKCPMCGHNVSVHSTMVTQK